MSISHPNRNSPQPHKPQAERLWEQACIYRDAFGWSIIPVKADKAPLGEWKQYQSEVADPLLMKPLYLNPRAAGIAVVTGPVSGDLICRDFDRPELYERWKKENPQLADTLPTVITPNGFHVYGIWHEPIRVEYVGDGEGEVRGEGGYNLLPPTHLGAGNVYRWIIPPEHGDLRALSSSEFATLSPNSATTKPRKRNVNAKPSSKKSSQGISTLSKADIRSLLETVSDAEYRRRGHEPMRMIEIQEQSDVEELPVHSNDSTEWTEKTKKAEETEKAESAEIQNEDTCQEGGADRGAAVSLTFRLNGEEYEREDLASIINEAIHMTLPQSEGTRNRKLFALARRLVAIGGRGVENAGAWMPFVREWHRRAEPNIRTKSWAVTWVEFLNGYGKVKVAHDEDAVSDAVQQADEAGIPPEVSGEERDVQRLASVCRELQRLDETVPFFLSCRRAAAFLGCDHRVANAYLRYLVINLELLEEVQKGGAGELKGKATRYRYLGQMG